MQCDYSCIETEKMENLHRDLLGGAHGRRRGGHHGGGKNGLSGGTLKGSYISSSSRGISSNSDRPFGECGGAISRNQLHRRSFWSTRSFLCTSSEFRFFSGSLCSTSEIGCIDSNTWVNSDWVEVHRKHRKSPAAAEEASALHHIPTSRLAGTKRQRTSPSNK